MAPKQQLDKDAWQWAEKVDPLNITRENIECVYRTNLKACKLHACRRNCRGNPHCLNCLGEREWFQEIKDSVWHDIEDPESERRNKTTFIGLKNLGATCYVNTFIQVWFHNPVLRSAIFAWRGEDGLSPGKEQNGNGHLTKLLPGADGQSDDTTTATCAEGDTMVETKADSTHEPLYGPEPKPTAMLPFEDKDLMPSTVCGHLQLIFGLLQFSNRRYIDPSSFIHCLGLDTAQQQDAQEFSKLFMSVLEDQLSKVTTVSPSLSPLPTLTPATNLIRDQFQGEYAYVTRCNACSGISKRPSDFYELDLNIKGHSNLSECIQEFLQEEKLENDNQYMCGNCNRKQNASRRICLQRLPNILNVQLLRFVFDRKSGHKKKLNTSIQFPEVLDLSSHVGEPEQSRVYNLVAVLVHSGPSAYSGHYVAHIKDTTSQSWYKFNDEDIHKIEGKNLQLGNEEESSAAVSFNGKGPKKLKFLKGAHSSRNAYMLVYVRREELIELPKPIALADLPDRLQMYIEKDMEAFNYWVKEMMVMRDTNVTNGRQRQDEIQQLLSLMAVKPGEEYDWIEAGWLSKWLAESTADKVPAIDNSPLCCFHGRVNPDNISKAKVISAAAAVILYAKYSGGPRLAGPDMMCSDCVSERCRIIRTKASVADDQKVVAAALKANVEPCEDSFWVGKASLRSWKRLVLENMEDTDNANSEGGSEETCPLPTNGDEKPVMEDASSKTSEVRHNFNDDIICEEHDQLVVREGCRILVLGDVWRRLRKYFPDAAEFKFGTEPCLECWRALEEEEAASQLAKTTAQQQRAQLSDLYNQKNRPFWSNDTTTLHLIPRDFTEMWRKFLRDPTRHRQVTEMSNSSFLCPHGGFMHDPEMLGLATVNESTQNIVAVWPKEWTVLKHLVDTDTEVVVKSVTAENGHRTFVTTPATCTDCQMSLREAEMQAKATYKNAVIFVRKVTDDNKAIIAPTGALPGDSPEASDKNDADFCTVEQNGKRKHTVSHGMSEEKQVRLDECFMRRSSRHRKMRGEKELIVSATTKLWDLKILLMKKFSAPPMDQHLYLGSTELVGNERTVGHLGVNPASVLYLHIDEPCDDPTLLDDEAKAGKPEEGFKGTGLLNGTFAT